MNKTKTNAECDLCGKVFYDNGQKFRPIYAMKAHRKTCRTKRDRVQRRFIKNFIENEASKLQINSVYEYIKDLKEGVVRMDSPTNFAPSPLPIPEPSPCPSDLSFTTNSDCEQWIYNGDWYEVDNKNRVFYWNSTTIAGTRQKCDLSGEWLLIKDD